MTKTKTGRFSRLIAMLLTLIMVCGMLPAPAFAEGETGQGENTDQIIYASYALEFSYTDGEDNTTFYETADVKKISVTKIAEQLGLTGEITNVEGSNPFKCYYTQEEDDGWYLYTTYLVSGGTGEPYTGDLFDGLPSFYYPGNYDIVITVDGVEQTVVMKYIATPVQLNDPGAVDGVTVGDTIYTFASGMPLSTVYIDNTHFETPTSWKMLTDEPGFVFRVPTEFNNVVNGDFDKIWAIYDPNIPGATQLDSTKENYFAGNLFSFTFDNAAILSDGRVANVRITYSDAYITIDKRATSGFPYSICLVCGKHMSTVSSDTRKGNETIDGERYSKAFGAASRMTATIQIVDDDGNPIDGSFISCVDGINVRRTIGGILFIKALGNSYLYDFWCESVQVNGGTLSDIYVRPNNEEEEPFLPDTYAKPYQRQWYYSYVTENDRGIKFTGVPWVVSDGDALIIGGGHNHYYSAGFVTTADAYNGIRFENYSAGVIGSSPQTYDTYYMDGYSVWHRIRSSSTHGGTIQTTTEGNVGGALSDGGTVLKPGTYVVPDGKTVVYTMTPEAGYELDSVTVKSNSLSYSGGNDVTASVTPVYDGSGGIAYYTYTFQADKANPQNNHENQAIHVKWRKIETNDLTIKKTSIGGDDTFDFHIHIKIEGEKVTSDAWKKVASWTTTWRPGYSFAHVTSVSYPLKLDGVTYNDDVDRMTFVDDSCKLLLYGSCDENNTPESQTPTNGSSETLTLYKALDAEGNPYTITIDGTTYALYSDSKDWKVTGETGSNEANFWVYDETGAIHNYFDIFAQSETVTLESLDLSEYGGTPVDGSPGVYEFPITTTDGEGVLTLNDLPYGYNYSIEEQPKAGWQQTVAEYANGDLTTDKTAVFTNQRVGDLTVTKTLDGNAADSGKAFSFTIELSDTTINGEYNGVTFTDGVATITLKGGESKTIEGLPSGTGYVVTEESYANEGYITTKTGDTGSIIGGSVQTAAFTNTRDTYGGLVVTKTVDGNAPIEGAEFSFTVTLSDTSITGTYGEMNFTNGIATFTLKNGESKTASDLPNGITYEVTEANYTNDGYVTTSTGATGTIVGNGEQTAAFTNTRNANGSLTVSKTLEGNDTDGSKEFTFTIVLSDTTINGEYSGVTFENGVATITLKGGESKTIEGLPNGTKYTVTEVDYSGDGYELTDSTGASGTIDENKPMVVAFTNTRNTYGDLIVTKTVTGNAASTTKEFTFTVTLSDNTISGTFDGMTFTDGVATFTLKHDESKKATGLPNGVDYTVVESDNSGYTVTKTGDTGTIVGNNEQTAAFTNTRNSTPPPDDPPDDPKTGNLTVSKTVAGEGADQNKEFSFTVTLSDTTINGTYGDMTFTNGVATFTLTGGESKTATGLPAGITYVVTEADYFADGYVTTKIGDTGKIVANTTATAAFMNTKTPPPPDNPEYGSLTVKKTVTGDLADKDQYFTFTITFDAPGSYSYTGSKSGTIKSGDTVELKHGESITISGLPAGTTYVVTESGNNGYRVYASGDKGTIAANATSTAAFTNARSSVPQTGDDSHLLLWLSMAGISGLGMLLTGIFRRKRKGKHSPAR